MLPGKTPGVERPGVHLMRTEDRIAEVDAFVDRLGGRVGLRGVLTDLDRSAERVRVPAAAATWGFRWDREDAWSNRWWPQGISTCADAWDVDVVDGRSVLVTSSYSRRVDDFTMGSRLTFVDLTDRDAIRYRHVLLVEPFLRDDGSVDVRPVQVHAGGIVWHGDYVHVAGTARGFSSFHLDDIVRAPVGDAARLRIRDESPATVDAFGHRYMLPVRFTYDAGTAAGVRRMRYSFASLDRSTTPHAIVVGEYGRGRYPTRLARYPVDPVTSLLHADEGASHPTLLSYGGVPRMQGAAVVDGTWFVTTSDGPLHRGSVWVGEPGELHERSRVLPVGPEDIAYWPQRDELWSVSEYPGARYVFSMSRARMLDE
jgi:hypothetical protein